MNFYFKLLWGRCGILWQSPLNITVLGHACAERGVSGTQIKQKLQQNGSKAHCGRG